MLSNTSSAVVEYPINYDIYLVSWLYHIYDKYLSGTVVGKQLKLLTGCQARHRHQ